MGGGGWGRRLIPTTGEAEAGETIYPRRGWLHGAARVRLHIKKKKKKKDLILKILNNIGF